MREQPYDGLNLFCHSGNRKYLNTAERNRFVETARRAPPKVRLFCLMLGWSGARISEVLALTPASIDIESGGVSIETLKRRKHASLRTTVIYGDVMGPEERAFAARMWTHPLTG
jgi:integrase